jgi:two-component system OmpR family response regulator
MTSLRLAILDDDEDVRGLLQRYLQQQGFEAYGAADAAGLFRILDEHEIDLVVLDLMMPGEDGFQVCRRLRASSTIPIIMLTAKKDDVDRIVGLEMGADDYVTKPFNPRELVARIRAVMWRVRAGAAPEGATAYKLQYRFDNWTLNAATRTLRDATGNEVELSGGEFALLMVFLQNSGRVLNRDQLFDLTRGPSSTPVDRGIDIQVSRLRRKIEPGDGPPRLLKTVRGAGYVFTPKVTAT